MRDAFERVFFFIFVTSCHLSLILQSIGSLCQNLLLISLFDCSDVFRVNPDNLGVLVIRFVLYPFITGLFYLQPNCF